jgi:hypothetical protein
VDLLTPFGLLFGLLALPILILYMLKLRRREVEVPSTLLWQLLLRDRQANAPWQRLKRNLLLFLQLLILGALAFALARPAVPVPAVAAGAVVVLLDASASMNAIDVQPNRFEAARTAARKLIENLPNGSRMTLILAGIDPQILISSASEKAELERALASANPTQGSTDWEAALALAAGALAAGTTGAGSDSQAARMTTVILSDGGLPAQGLPPLPGEVRYLPVGKGSDNLAISALAVRTSEDRTELFVRVDNYGDAPRRAALSFYAGEELFAARQLELPSGQSASEVITGLPAGQGFYQARLAPLDRGEDGRLDDLPLDDVAFAINRPDSLGRTLLVSSQPEGNFFLEQVLAAMPKITAYRALPGEGGELQIPGEPFDLYIFDGALPDELPVANLLLINPATNPLFEVSGVFTPTTSIQVTEHSLTRFLDWQEVHVAKARQIETPEWGEVLVHAGDYPLVFAGETGGRRVAVVAFDLHDSDLPLQVAFPILFHNLSEFLIPGQAFETETAIAPGESLRITPGPAAEQVLIASPSGQVFSYTPGEEGIQFSETGELGVYAVNILEGDSQTADYFSVNLFDERESNLRPAQTIQVGSTAISPSAEEGLGQREFWPWLAGLALAILLLEWWAFHGQQQIPGSWLTAFRRKKQGQPSAGSRQ